MKKIRNAIYQGANGKEALYDLLIPENPHLLLVFVHGYKGFKDWGSFPLWAEYFAQSGIAFLSFNFSHNGIGISEVDVLDDENGFSENRFSFELLDIKAVFNKIEADEILNLLPISIMAHSRGGGVSQVFVAENPVVRNLILMASVSDFSKRFPWDVEIWKRDGVAYVTNARTGQKLPHKYAFYQDYLDNNDRFDLAQARTKIACPTFVAIGDSDPAIPLWEAENIAAEIAQSTLKIYPETDHVFGAKHPYLAKELPQKVEELLFDVKQFISN